MNTEPTLESTITELRTEMPRLKALSETVKKLEDQNTKLQTTVTALEKKLIVPRGTHPIRRHEVVTHDCARFLASIAYLGAERFNKLSHLSPHSRDFILNQSAETVGIELRTALTATDIPLPTEFQSQVVELVWTYGDFRRYATPFPMGVGTVKLPKLKTSPAFGLIAMSGTVTEKSPQIQFVTFTAEKSGGIVRVPSEIDADSVVSVGQFIARYGAREMAKWADTWGFLADGSGTYDTKSGVCKP